MTISILILGFKGLRGDPRVRFTDHEFTDNKISFSQVMIWSACEALFDPVLTHGKSRKEVSENTAKGRQGKEWLQIANFRIPSLFIDNSNNCPLRVVTAGGNILNCYRHYVVWNWISVMWFEKKLRKLILCSKKINSSSILAIASTFPGADLGGGCRGCAPPLPEMTCGFLIQLVFCKKKNYVFYWCWSRARDECTPS